MPITKKLFEEEASRRQAARETNRYKKRRAGWGRGQGARKKLLRQTRTYRSGFASRYVCARFHTRSPRRRRSAASSYVHTLEDLASRSSSSQPFRIPFILRTINPPLERCFPLPLPLVCVRTLFRPDRCARTTTTTSQPTQQQWSRRTREARDLRIS